MPEDGRVLAEGGYESTLVALRGVASAESGGAVVWGLEGEVTSLRGDLELWGVLGGNLEVEEDVEGRESSERVNESTVETEVLGEPGRLLARWSRLARCMVNLLNSVPSALRVGLVLGADMARRP